VTEEQSLDYRVIRDEVDNLCQAVHNKIEREWPDELDPSGRLPVMLRALVLVSTGTFHTIRLLCSEETEDVGQKRELVTSVPPLTRTLVDTLFLIVFFYDAPIDNLQWYWKSAWREYSDELERARRDHADDPDWATWIRDLEMIVANCRTWWSVEEGAEGARTPRWPHPGAMLRHRGLSDDRKDYLQYLTDWYYRSLSQESHLSGPGLIFRAFLLFEYPENPGREQSLETMRMGGFFVALVILMAILAELEAELDLGLKPRISYVWTMMVEHSAPAKALYERRYRELLQ
jgi:hypothetical protein